MDSAESAAIFSPIKKFKYINRAKNDFVMADVEAKTSGHADWAESSYAVASGDKFKYEMLYTMAIGIIGMAISIGLVGMHGLLGKSGIMKKPDTK